LQAASAKPARASGASVFIEIRLLAGKSKASRKRAAINWEPVFREKRAKSRKSALGQSTQSPKVLETRQTIGRVKRARRRGLS
jgi:hypothetical protein